MKKSVIAQLKERLNYLDCAKGLAIILVILGHVDQGDNPLCDWLGSFHLPLFLLFLGFYYHIKTSGLIRRLLKI